MELHLKYAATPDNAPRFAGDIVESAQNVDDVILDYSAGSIRLVDDIIESFRGEGLRLDQVGETLFGFGCYVGQVLVHNANGHWRSTSETSMSGYASAPFVVELPGGLYCNPVDKAFKRLDNGAEDDLVHFYQTFAAGRG